MFRLRRCFLVGTTDRCLLRGVLRWRVFDFVWHIQLTGSPSSGSGVPIKRPRHREAAGDGWNAGTEEDNKVHCHRKKPSGPGGGRKAARSGLLRGSLPKKIRQRYLVSIPVEFRRKAVKPGELEADLVVQAGFVGIILQLFKQDFLLERPTNPSATLRTSPQPTSMSTTVFLDWASPRKCSCL